MSKSKLVWRGKETKQEVEQVLSDAIVEIDLRVEAKAKQNLKPSQRDAKGRWVKGGGRGKRTATLQRSIHAAAPDYNWSGDNGGADLGGKDFKPRIRGNKITGAVGSGLVYALALHQDDDSEGKHYLIKAYNEVQPEAIKIVKKHARKRRAKK